MNGKIRVVSNPREGTVFTVEIPAKVSYETRLFFDKGDIKFAYSILKGKKCLVVDDLIENSYIIQNFLRQQDIGVIACNTATEAITIYQNDNSLNAIITDLKLPGLSGKELIKEIRKIEKDQRRNKVIIIVISAETDAKERLACINEYGANDFLLKPIKLSEIIFSLYNTMANTKKEKKSILIADDENINSFYLSAILKEYGHNVKIADTSINAINIIVNDYTVLDLILLGSYADEASSIEILNKLNAVHNEKGGSKIAVVSMNNYSTKQQKKRYENYDIFAFLQKPLKKSEVLGIIDMIH